MVLQLSDRNIDEAIHTAINILTGGGIVAYPTETFYGMGVKYNTEPALRKLYELKKRPKEKAMPLIIGKAEELYMLTDSVNTTAKGLIDKYWPGPLTILFHARQGLSEYIVSGNRVAVRVPGNSFALKLAMASGFPITATSANISGMPPADSAGVVFNYFDDKVDLIIDGGRTKGGLPSTIVDVTGNSIEIIRKGIIDIKLG